VISVLVAAPRRVVSAALTCRTTFGLGSGYVTPGDELPGGSRVMSATVDGWVAAGGLEVTLSDAPGGTVVRASSPELAESVRTRALTLVDAPVVVGTAIVRGRSLLAQQRAYPAEAAGLWELPGGRVEPGESDVDAVVRECHEELGVEVTPGPAIGPDVALPNGKLLRIYRASLADPTARPHPHDHAALRWLTAEQLASVEWLPADRVLLPALRQTLNIEK
jgi:8-oxo-dGTP diphosphatase